ncbi:MAG: beta-ketoacyl-[acyl-carrier-protein] synthase II [Bacteroidetes bacterium CG2_30_33_31]|nr:MAG: beta-ketoacyl-[acyl-carrier-protein] synthase II [Bacteroidetes bacterium CG2_30_33_31]
MTLKRVVVTGIGALTPLGKTMPETWHNMINGVSGAGPITQFNAEKFKTKFACELKGYEATDYFDKKEARKLDPCAQFGIIAATQAVEDSGMDLEKSNLERIGVIWGSGIGGLKTFLDEVSDYARGDGTPRFNPFFIPKMIADITAGHISIKFGFMGPNFTTVSACASSANALSDAFNYIRLGKADAFVTGGSEASINEAGIGGFNALHAISTRNDDPKTASRPYDLNRDGFVLGEGGCAMIFEELEHARARGAKIYAEVVGAGLSGDAYHMTAPHPEGLGAKNCMREAILDAGLKPEDIDHINTHGTSTPVGDVAEPKAIMSLFGDHATKILVNSTKSMTGHLLGAAGAIEAASCVMAVKEGIIPPTINHFDDDPDIPKLNFVFNKAVKKNITYALSNTFGFGGHNASIIFKKFDE